jgi:hypothetical protein
MIQAEFASAQAHYNDLLKEAEEYRRAALLNKEPNLFERALTAVKGAFAAKPAQPAAREAQAMRKGLVTK